MEHMDKIRRLWSPGWKYHTETAPKEAAPFWLQKFVFNLNLNHSIKKKKRFLLPYWRY